MSLKQLWIGGCHLVVDVSGVCCRVGWFLGGWPGLAGRVGDFGDFGVSDVATVAGRYTRRGGPRLSVQGEPLVVLTRGP